MHNTNQIFWKRFFLIVIFFFPKLEYKFAISRNSTFSRKWPSGFHRLMDKISFFDILANKMYSTDCFEFVFNTFVKLRLKVLDTHFICMLQEFMTFCLISLAPQELVSTGWTVKWVNPLITSLSEFPSWKTFRECSMSLFSWKNHSLFRNFEKWNELTSSLYSPGGTTKWRQKSLRSTERTSNFMRKENRHRLNSAKG